MSPEVPLNSKSKATNSAEETSSMMLRSSVSSVPVVVSADRGGG